MIVMVTPELFDIGYRQKSESRRRTQAAQPEEKSFALRSLADHTRAR